MPTTSRKPSTFLIFPWGLLSIVLVLGLNLTLDSFGADYSGSYFGEFQSRLFHYEDHVHESGLFINIFSFGRHGFWLSSFRLAY